MIDVSIAIVSFNTKDLLCECLRSVLGTAALPYEVWVVDNDSRDGSADVVASEYPTVRLVRSHRNVGFAAAANVAIARSQSRYILLLNPDSVVPPGAIDALVRFMDEHPDAGICGPCIRFPDGRFESCGHAFPTLSEEIRQSRNLGWLLRKLSGKRRIVGLPGAPEPVDWVDGACLLARRETIREIGLLDERFFLYSEELDWCRTAWRSGWRVYSVPEVDVIHHQGKSTEHDRQTAIRHLIETRLQYYSKNHGVWYAALVSLVYAGGCVRQLHRDRQKSVAKLRAVGRWWSRSLSRPEARA